MTAERDATPRRDIPVGRLPASARPCQGRSHDSAAGGADVDCTRVAGTRASVTKRLPSLWQVRVAGVSVRPRWGSRSERAGPSCLGYPGSMGHEAERSHVQLERPEIPKPSMTRRSVTGSESSGYNYYSKAKAQTESGQRERPRWGTPLTPALSLGGAYFLDFLAARSSLITSTRSFLFLKNRRWSAPITSTAA